MNTNTFKIWLMHVRDVNTHACAYSHRCELGFVINKLFISLKDDKSLTCL